jgi:hypothetical protein
VGDDYSKLKDDVAFRLEQAEKVGLGFEIPKPPMLSVEMMWLLKQKAQRKVMNRDGKSGRGEWI